MDRLTLIIEDALWTKSPPKKCKGHYPTFSCGHYVTSTVTTVFVSSTLLSETRRPLILITPHATSVTPKMEQWKYLINYKYSIKNGFVCSGKVKMNVKSEMEFPYERHSVSMVFLRRQKWVPYKSNQVPVTQQTSRQSLPVMCPLQ